MPIHRFRLGSHLAGKQPTRTTHRFLTGIALGLILVIALGAFVPLMAQSPSDSQPVLPSATEEETRPSPTFVPIDIDDNIAENCIRELALRRLLPADARIKYRPEAEVTWAFLGELLNAAFPTAGAYSGANAAETALELPTPVNMLHSYPDRYYQPDRAITRTEAVTAIATKANLPYVARANELLLASLTDGEQISHYGREGVAAALSAGVLVNYPETQQFEANRVVTRDEVAALVCRGNANETVKATVAADLVARPQQLSPQQQSDPEVRGVWLTNIDSDVLFSQEKLKEGIQRLKIMNVNTLYPVVWNFGYPQFPSATAERLLGRKKRLLPADNPAFEAAQGDRDMLQEIIELAHAEGMAVIPWFEFGFMAPADYDVLAKHPDWFTERLDGTREIQQGEETFTWMNPFHPRTRQLLLLLMAEVLENYDVEGLQVDDHLGMPVDMGYDPFTISLYEEEHDGQSPPEDENDPEWVAWRANKITEFMVQVRLLIDQRQPGGILSVSPNPYPFSYVRYLQDWPTWTELNLVDELIIQVYRGDLERFVWELNKPTAVAANRSISTAIGLLSGLRNRPTDIDLLTEQLAAVRDRDYAGVSYFFYETLWVPGKETSEERQTEFQEAFLNTVDRPE
ncbi:MAG: family 10 glycosylhydrolase [Cyanobacteria bacterium P01_H01_bin.58]